MNKLAIKSRSKLIRTMVSTGINKLSPHISQKKNDKYSLKPLSSLPTA